MVRSRKGVPAAFSIGSALYFLFVVSSGSSRMIGDDGGDPGSMLLPLTLSIGMFVLSVYLFLKDKPVEDEPLTKDEKKLFTLTVFSCVLYVLLYRSVGFVLLSVILLFLLTFSYSSGTVSFKNVRYGGIGLLFSIVFIIGLYSAGRFLTRFLFQSAQSTGLLWLNSAFSVFAVNLIVLTVFFLLVKKISGMTLAKKLQTNSRVKTCYTCVFVSVASVELLFLIFRQLFLVNLARGIMYW